MLCYLHKRHANRFEAKQSEQAPQTENNTSEGSNTSTEST